MTEVARATWVEVDRAALTANYDAVAAHAGVPVCAVIKANGYGHGVVHAARTFAAAGAAMLGVTRIDEARAIRDAGVDAPILILMPADPAAAAALGCEVTVGSAEDIATLPAGARAHLKVDTGMGRLGVHPSEAVAAAEAIAARATLAAVWTHLADAAGASGRAQLERFRAVLSALRHHGIEARAHASNSAGLLARPDARFDMVRIGTLLYGQDPPGASAPWAHAETFAWYARVVAVRRLEKGSPVGYGSEWTAPAPARVGTLAVGYADGLTVEPQARTASTRELARAAKTAAARALGRDRRVVWFGDRAAPIVGRVAMQATTVLLDGLDDIGVGSVARVPARRLMVSPLIERVWA